ncbi:MAG: CoA pyrophosphatase [Flavobacteriaceae bacterium]|nr:CoA pyrophosphatase [Flavobacteriia bacterium]
MTLQELKACLPQLQTLPLPGLTAQLTLAPPSRQRYVRMAQQQLGRPKKAAVLLLLYPDASHRLCFALIRRADYPGVHSGQIGFPGGKIEETDRSSWAAALRETHEEIGVPPQAVHQLRALSALYIPPSNFTVDPFLAWTPKTPQFTLDHKEVDGLIQVPLVDFLACQPKHFNAQLQGDATTEAIPYFELQQHKVWGATAMMLAEFQQLMWAFKG